MGEPHVISALSNKQAELAGIVSQLERRLGQQQANLAHLDATMRLFDPDIRPNKIRPKQQRARSAWFRLGECLRLIYDELVADRGMIRPRSGLMCREPSAALSAATIAGPEAKLEAQGIDYILGVRERSRRAEVGLGISERTLRRWRDRPTAGPKQLQNASAVCLRECVPDAPETPVTEGKDDRTLHEATKPGQTAS
jgi:hypothetical protein